MVDSLNVLTELAKAEFCIHPRGFDAGENLLHCWNSLSEKEVVNLWWYCFTPDTAVFSAYIHQTVDLTAKGRNHHRWLQWKQGMYSRSGLFRWRSLPIGVIKYRDLVAFTSSTRYLRSAERGTSVFAPLGGIVHSFAFSDNHGTHRYHTRAQLDGMSFTTYGHMSMSDFSWDAYIQGNTLPIL